MYEKNGVLVFERHQGDIGILEGIRYGIRIKTFRNEELSEGEADLASRIDAHDQLPIRGDATLKLTVDDARVATEAIKRNLEFQEKYDTCSHTIGDLDRQALPKIERFTQAAQV